MNKMFLTNSGYFSLIVFVVGFGVLLNALLLPSVFASTINTLSDGSTSKNITFTGNQNQIDYLNIPKYSWVTNAQLNLTGYNYTSIENDTESESAYSGDIVDPSKAYDENWNPSTSSAYVATAGMVKKGFIYENYTVNPNAASGNATLRWEILAWFTSPSINNYTNITTYCWNYSNTSYTIIFNNKTSYPITGSQILVVTTSNISLPLSCFSGVNKVIFKTGLEAYSGDVGGEWTFLLYTELKTVFNYSNLNTNLTLDVTNDGDKEWSYSDSFNQTNNRTSDFSSELNDYLWSCFPISGNCSVPLLFHSDSIGLLQISDINVTYNPDYNYQVDYPLNVFSGGSDTISLKIKNSSVINNATLIWNGTTYSTDTVTNLGDMNTYSTTFTAPVVSSNINASFYWNFYVNNIQENTSAYNQSMYFVGMDNCSSFTVKAMTFTIYNESTLTTMAGTLELVFSLYLNPTTTTTYSTKYQNNYTYSLCLNLNTTNYTFDGYMSFYNTSGSGYPTRTYWFYHAPLNNVTQNVSLYLIPTGESEEVTFTIKDSTGYPYPDLYAVIQRFFPALNSYTTIQIGKSDSNGQMVTYLIPYSTYYKILLMQNGQVIQTINPFLITSNSMSFNVNTSYGVYFYKYYGKIAYSCAYSYGTGYFTCTITDTSGEMTKCYLDIMTVNTTNNQQICNVNGVSSSMTIGCDLGNITGKNYFYSVYCDLKQGKTILEKDFVGGGNPSIIPPIPIFGIEGVFLTFMVTGTMSFIGLNINPTLGILLLFTALFGCMAMGLIALIPAVVVSFLLVGVIIIFWSGTL